MTPARKPGRHGYPSQASRVAAQAALADVIEDARLDGYRMAIAEIEREVYSSESTAELLRWVRKQNQTSDE